MSELGGWNNFFRNRKFIITIQVNSGSSCFYSDLQSLAPLDNTGSPLDNKYSHYQDRLLTKFQLPSFRAKKGIFDYLERQTEKSVSP